MNDTPTPPRQTAEDRLPGDPTKEELIERIVCPIGIAGITGKEPEVIAVSAVAQLLQASSPKA